MKAITKEEYDKIAECFNKVTGDADDNGFDLMEHAQVICSMSIYGLFGMYMQSDLEVDDMLEEITNMVMSFMATAAKDHLNVEIVTSNAVEKVKPDSIIVGLNGSNMKTRH